MMTNISWLQFSTAVANSSKLYILRQIHVMNFAFVNETLLCNIYLALCLDRNRKTHLNSLQTVKHLPKWQERFTCRHTIMKFLK